VTVTDQRVFAYRWIPGGQIGLRVASSNAAAETLDPRLSCKPGRRPPQLRASPPRAAPQDNRMRLACALSHSPLGFSVWKQRDLEALVPAEEHRPRDHISSEPIAQVVECRVEGVAVVTIER
jgi:hypothetical protein